MRYDHTTTRRLVAATSAFLILLMSSPAAFAQTEPEPERGFWRSFLITRAVLTAAGLGCVATAAAAGNGSHKMGKKLGAATSMTGCLLVVLPEAFTTGATIALIQEAVASRDVEPAQAIVWVLQNHTERFTTDVALGGGPALSEVCEVLNMGPRECGDAGHRLRARHDEAFTILGGGPIDLERAARLYALMSE